MPFIHKTAIILLALAVAASAQKKPGKKPPTADSKPVAAAPANTAAEDITGMYTFLREGEFVQIILDQSGVSGYISRMGASDSDKGEFLDQFFSKAAITGHDVSFTTKPIHGIWFEFKGRFDRGQAKAKTEDGYYVIHGTLTEFTLDAEKKNTTSHSREVDFKSLAQPDEGTQQ